MSNERDVMLRRTSLCNVSNIHSLLVRHEAEDGENNEACVQTGCTINQRHDESIPAKTTSTKLRDDDQKNE